MARFSDATKGDLKVALTSDDSYDEFEGSVPLVGGASFTIGAEASNVINVAIQLQDPDGQAIEEAAGVWIGLTSDSAGLDFQAADAALSSAIGTDGSLLEISTDALFFATSEADGDIDIDFTKTDAGTFYVVVFLPTGELAVSSAVTFV